MTTALAGRTLDAPLLSDRFHPLSHVSWVRHADSIVLLDLDRGIYYTLNVVAGRIWELIVAGEPVVEIIRCVSDEFEVTEDVLLADCGRIVDQFCRLRLIERAPN